VPLIYFRAIWSILLPFGTFYGYLVYLFPALVCCTKKNLASQQDFAANNQIKSITAVSPEGPILQFCPRLSKRTVIFVSLCVVRRHATRLELILTLCRDRELHENRHCTCQMYLHKSKKVTMADLGRHVRRAGARCA
jgi:hypothetical protein